ncbi:MAG: TnpV protein [Brevinema sp.]
MKLNYIRNGDYFLPEIALSEQNSKPLGKYGRLRRTYLQEHRQALFNYLVLSEKLFVHLYEVDEQAQHLLDTMIPPMAKSAAATKQLKATDPMRWVGLMNTIKAQVEEIILAKLIYCEILDV